MLSFIVFLLGLGNLVLATTTSTVATTTSMPLNQSPSTVEGYSLIAIIAGSIGGFILLLFVVAIAALLVTKRRLLRTKAKSEVELPENQHLPEKSEPPEAREVQAKVSGAKSIVALPEKFAPLPESQQPKDSADYVTEYGGQIALTAAPSMVIEKGSRLGGGNFGEVFEANMDGLPIALKKLKGNAERDLKRELAMHQAAAAVCRQVAKAFCLWRDSDGELYFGMELCPRGCLLDIQDSSQTRALLWSAAQGLDELHRKGFLHRDVAARNILVRESANGSLEAVYTDFGLATRKKKPRPFVGFPWRITPVEVVIEGRWSVASDVYSFGFLIWELLSGQRPWPAFNERPIGSSFLRAIETAHPKPVDMTLYEYSLFLRCTAYNAEDRPSLSELIKAQNASRVSLSGVEYPE